ncbi:MAG: lipopolysaccharide assembly protein LapA domain-containing protein [Candidatus Zixiibacteriota bacterium]
MWVIKAIMIALLVIGVVAFAYFNISPAQKVDVNLIYVKLVEVPLVTVVFWSFVAGLMVSLILFISVYIKLSVQLRFANKRINTLDGEVTALRNRPIEESAGLLNGTDEKKLEVKSPLDNGI